MTDNKGDILGEMHAGVKTGIIVMSRAVEGDEFLSRHQGFAFLQGEHLLGKFWRGNNMPGNHQVGRATNVKRELLLEVTRGEVTVGCLAQHGLPLLADGGNAHAQQCCGTGIGKRHQVLTHLVVVKQDDIACCLLHISAHL